MLLNNNSHVRGIFKYSEDVYFEKDDFVVDGNCIYVCKSSEPIKGERPSLDTYHLYYSEYPGDKTVSAEEYYNYLESADRGGQAEDKYVSAHTLCEILENMYFGFGDNGIVYDHVIYNPNTGIEYCIRGVHEVLDYSTPNVLDTILRKNDLNNGLIKISRGLPEIRDLVMDSSASSDVVVLKQYTYLDSDNFIPYRVQELMDPEKNKLYFRFAKGEALEEGGNDFTDATVSQWKNLYSSNEDAIEKLNSIENYYNQKIQESEAKVARISGKYCYREVEATETNHLGSSIVYLRPGETRDIKSRESFDTSPCLLNILIKAQASQGVYRNYSLVIDIKDACDSTTKTETYLLGDGLELTSNFDGSESIQTVTLSVSGGGVIKSIYYRDYTLGHIHDWVLYSIMQEATCTEPGEGVYKCSECSEQKTEIIPPLGHTLTHKAQKNPTCVESGWWEYWLCSRCGEYFKDQDATEAYSGWNTGNDQVYRASLGAGGHVWSSWRTTKQPTCTTAGKKVRSCTICGQTQTQTISALGHNVSFVSGTSETCGDFGINEHYHCSRCGKDFSDSAATHQMNSDDLLKYPTGHHRIELSIDPIVLDEPTYSDNLNVDEPKPEFGRGLRICEDCSNEIEVSLPLKKHTFTAEEVPGDAFVVNGMHYPSYTQGTVEIDGVRTRRRNYNFRDDIPIDRQLENHTITNDHTSRVGYTPATCTEYGYWTGTCLLCGATNVRQYNWDDPPTGHTIEEANRDEWIPNTCTTNAQWEGTCSVCGHSHVLATDDDHLKIGHKDDNHDDICDVCHADLEPTDE